MEKISTIYLKAKRIISLILFFSDIKTVFDI